MSLHFRHTWSGGKESALDGKGPVFESDRTRFFSNGKHSASDKTVALLFVCSFCRLSCHIVELFFNIYIVSALGVLIFSAVCNFLSLDFVYFLFLLFFLLICFCSDDFGLNFIGLVTYF